MGVLLKMDTTQFMGKFIESKKFSDYFFILVSDDITTLEKYPNIISAKNLLPTQEIMREYVHNGIGDEYISRYFQYLKEKENMKILSAIVQEVVINDKNIVFLCSTIEDEKAYLKFLCNFIEGAFNMQTLSLKKYLKLKGKIEIDYDVEAIEKKLHKANKTGVTSLTELISESKEIKAKLIDSAEKMEKKKLIKFCKDRGFRLDADAKRKFMIKELYNELFSKFIFVKK